MRTRTGFAPLLAVLLAGCFSHRVASEPIEIKPIHITMDINLKVQRELDEFFDFEEAAGRDAVEADSQRAKEGK
jgi:hypothetical protein